MKQTIFFFLLAGIFLGSCASDPCKNKKDKADTVKVKPYKTVQNLDSIKNRGYRINCTERKNLQSLRC